MAMTTITESVVEEAALDWFRDLGYQYVGGPDIACDGSKPERTSYADVILPDRLWAAMCSLNLDIPAETLEDAFKKVMRSESPSLILNNQLFHKMLTDGVNVEYRNKEGRIAYDKVWLVDFAYPGQVGPRVGRHFAAGRSS